MNSKPQKRKLGEALLESGLISEAQLALALSEQRRKGGFLGDALEELGFVSQQEISKLLANQSQTDFVDVLNTDIAIETLNLLSSDFCLANKLIPIEHDENNLKVAMADTFDIVAVDTLEKKTGLYVEVFTAGEQEILEAIQEKYIQAETIDSLIDKASQTIRDKDELEAGLAAPLVRLVDRILVEAIRKRATDIHFEPGKKTLSIRFRIDGILYQESLLPKNLQAAIEARIKVMAHLDVTEHRLPQDGRISFTIGHKQIDLRVSTLPTHFGQSMVLRVLNKNNVVLDLNRLGLEGDDLESLKRSLVKPHGIILVTGPTGSGKTTTLYASLEQMNSKEQSIFTLEDPIEYDLSGIRQVQVHADIGLTFSEGLRSLLRQDPDTILVGEIRDEETAELATRAALTGHLVLSTLHTNSAVGAIPRLVNMGVEPYLLSSALLLVAAQRLVRRICSNCSYNDENPDLILNRLHLKAPENATFKKGKGCSECFHTGYRGRVAIYEMLQITDELRAAIKPGLTEGDLLQIAKEQDMQFMLQDGLKKASLGLTSLEDVARLVG